MGKLNPQFFVLNFSVKFFAAVFHNSHSFIVIQAVKVLLPFSIAKRLQYLVGSCVNLFSIDIYKSLQQQT